MRLTQRSWGFRPFDTTWLVVACKTQGVATSTKHRYSHLIRPLYVKQPFMSTYRGPSVAHGVQNYDLEVKVLGGSSVIFCVDGSAW